MERVAIAVLRGAEAAAVIEDLADLRLTIFREFPYLYDGKREDERDYLAQYAKTPEALVVTVTDAGKVVGAATGMPLAAEGAELVEPVAGGSRYPVEQIYYVGELLFYREYRNRGLGLKLLAEIERQVRALGDLETSFTWRELDGVSSPHPMKYWIRELL